MFKFLHTADIHLDSPLLSLQRYEGAPIEAFRSATRRAFDNIIDLAIEQNVRFVLIAGDLYDGDCRDFQTAIHFRRQMERLEEHDIRVFICQGNHDAQSNISKAFRLQLPANVHLFPTNRPETVRIDELQVAIHGQGFATRAVEEDLSPKYPDPIAGWLNIGLLHTSCGSYESHDPYAPSTIAGLSQKGYDYWALGHIHKREILAGPRPQIVYPGNVQGRHIGETGEKGCMVVSVDGEKMTLKFHATDVLRWEVCKVDAAACDHADDLPAMVRADMQQLVAASDRPLAVRVVVAGQTQAHHDIVRSKQHWDRELRTDILDHFSDRVWVEKIKIKTLSAIDLTKLEDRGDSLAELIAGIKGVSNYHYLIDELDEEVQRLSKLIPTDPRLGVEQIDWGNTAVISDMIDEAKDLLISRLLHTEEDG